jgi:hypothetical protein
VIINAQNLAMPAGRITMRAIQVWFGCLALICAATALAQAQEPLITVMNPTGNAPAIELKPMAPRPQSLDGKTIYLVDVTFNGGDKFLQQMQEWMAVHTPKIKTIFRVKKGAYAADDPDLWKEIQSVNGLMIMAIGH